MNIYFCVPESTSLEGSVCALLGLGDVNFLIRQSARTPVDVHAPAAHTPSAGLQRSMTGMTNYSAAVSPAVRVCVQNRE